MKKNMLLLAPVFALALVGCVSEDSGSQNQPNALVSMNLKQSSMAGAQSLIVDVDHVEVLLKRDGENYRLHLLPNLGPIDLLNLGQSLELGLADLNMPENFQMSQVRLLLREGGHYLVKADGTSCALQTPSGQQSGLKIKVDEHMLFQSGMSYTMDLSIDLDHQIVIQGNGGCLMKPVIHMSSLTEIVPVVDDGDTPPIIDDGTDDPPSDVDDDENVANPGMGDGEEWTDINPDDLPVIDSELP
jgi:hypothetical protein